MAGGDWVLGIARVRGGLDRMSTPASQYLLLTHSFYCPKKFNPFCRR